jgi:hypothetical protein
MNGIGRSVVWVLLPLVGACDSGGSSSPNANVSSGTEESLVSSGSSVPSETSSHETSGHTAGPTSGATAEPSDEGTSQDDPDTSSHDNAGESSTATQTSATSDTSAAPPIVGERELGARCARDERWGALGVNLSTDRTIIAGAVSNGVLPSSVPAVASEVGACQLLVPRNLLCSSCASNQACAGDDVCVDKPSKVSAGALRVDGLLTDVEVAPNAITGDYSKTVIDPYPAYNPGDALTLRAQGDIVAAFEAELVGVPALTSSLTSVAVKRGEGAILSWDAESADAEATAVFISFSVNVHGAVTGWIECTAPDTGEFEIPEELVSELIDLGSSGFPRVDLERRSSAVVALDPGCVELYVGSKITLEIELDGLTSCHDDDDCADGQSCNEELACE